MMFNFGRQFQPMRLQPHGFAPPQQPSAPAAPIFNPNQAGWMGDFFGQNFDHGGYLSAINSWAGARPENAASLDAWRAQMPNMAGFGPAPGALPQQPGATNPYPVTQVGGPTQQMMQPNPYHGGGAEQIAPVPGQPQTSVPPQGQQHPMGQPGQPLARRARGGFFGSRG